MTNEESILEMDIQVNNIMKDLRSRIHNVYDKYTSDSKKKDIKLPEYSLLVKDRKLRFQTASDLTDAIDELNDIKLRITIVSRNLNGMRNVQITSVSDYTLVNNFKSNLKKFCDELTEYKFDIVDLSKNANNKFRLLDSISFYEQ